MIPISRPLIGNEEKQAVLDVLSTGMLADGEIVREFEKTFANFVGVKHAIATSSGTTALHASLIAHGIKEGDEVITTPFTFISTANSIKMCGAIPIFVDIDERTYNIDPNLIEKVITSKTKAILPVHLFGRSADMDQIMEIAKKHNLFVIEDACQAHGAKFNKKNVGSFGTGCFSFYPTKNMTTGEGGMITTNDDSVALKAKMLISHGSSEKYVHQNLGYNYRMTNIAAAIGLEQLKKLSKFNENRRNNALYFSQKLASVNGVTVPEDVPGHVYHQYTLLIKNRDDFQNKMRKNGIMTAVHYPTPIHKQEAYSDYSKQPLPVAERISKKVVSLPVSPFLQKSELNQIVESIRSIKHSGEGEIEMDKQKVETVLGRKEHDELVNLDISNLAGQRVLITGANGSIGNALIKRLNDFNEKSSNGKIDFLSTDIEGKHTYMDITDFNNVFSVVNKYKPTIIVNIAGAKHAPEGEHETWKTLSVNTLGTKNLIDCALNNCKIILTSTCKSANPEIVYGASKLIAERMVLNEGGSVARYFNVVESSGNVFEIWRAVDIDQPIKVAPTCQRHFISLNEATGLIFHTMLAEPGRYVVNSGHLLKMGDIAERLYPGRKKEIIRTKKILYSK